MSPATAVTIVLVTGIVTTGAVLIFRPLARRLETLLQAMADERARPQGAHDLAQIRDILTGMDSRLAMLEERQDFAEALISSGDPKLVTLRGASLPQERN